jgi:hypothetical protein
VKQKLSLTHGPFVVKKGTKKEGSGSEAKVCKEFNASHTNGGERGKHCVDQALKGTKE